MTIQEFMDKWLKRDELAGEHENWKRDPSIITWILSYEFKSELALEVCKDYLSITGAMKIHRDTYYRATQIVNWHLARELRGENEEETVHGG